MRRAERHIERRVAHAARGERALRMARHRDFAEATGRRELHIRARPPARAQDSARRDRAVERGRRHACKPRRIEPGERRSQREVVRLVQCDARRPGERPRLRARTKPRYLDALIGDERRQRERQVAIADVGIDRLALRVRVTCDASGQPRRHELRMDAREVHTRDVEREVRRARGSIERDARLALDAAAVDERRVDAHERKRIALELEARREASDRKALRVDRPRLLVHHVERSADAGTCGCGVDVQARARVRQARIERRRIDAGQLERGGRNRCARERRHDCLHRHRCVAQHPLRGDDYARHRALDARRREHGH